MRVLLATHASLEVDSGEERTLQELGRQLLARGHQVRFANFEGLLDNARRKSLAEIRAELPPAEFVSVPDMRFLGPFLAIPNGRGFRALAESMRWADVVVFGQFYGFDAAVYLLGRIVGRPLVCSQANALRRPFRNTVRDALQEGYERTLGLALLGRFQGVRVCNSDDLQYLTRAGCRRVVLLYPPNTDLATERAEPSLPGSVELRELSAERRFKLLVAGRMTHQKGLDLLARAVLRLGKDRASVLDRMVILLAGAPQLPPVLDDVLLRHPGVFRNLGVVPRSEFPRVLTLVDAVLMPSRYESFGRVAAEAQSLGKPVVATDVTGLREVVTPGETGLLVRSWSADTLAATIQELYTIWTDDPERWSRMGVAARANFVERFGPERSRAQMDAFVAALEELAAGPSRR